MAIAAEAAGDVLRGVAALVQLDAVNLLPATVSPMTRERGRLEDACGADAIGDAGEARLKLLGKATTQVDSFTKASRTVLMKTRGLLALIRRLGCTVDPKRGKGSHVLVTCPGGCVTTIPNHRGEDIRPGTLRAIERQLEKCLGPNWTKKG